MWWLRQIDEVKTVVLYRAKDRGDIFVFNASGCYISTDFTADLEELLSARAIYNLSGDAVEERFNLVSGIARFVLEKPEDMADTIESAIGRLSIEKFKMIADGRLQKEDEIKFFLEKALEVFITQEESKLHTFLLASNGETLFSSLCGNLFESFAHRQLLQGGTFKTRSLDNTAAAVVDLVLPVQLKQAFKDIKKCMDRNVLYTAVQKNYPCVDSLIPSVGLFQMKSWSENGSARINLLTAGGTIAVRIDGA
ncbi:hypothetical protein HK100_003744 [Physocladia obscura]|uniref:Uncharacterized protein n=1 Tax=Physocladia obscura TaxID=109957 RepID=A0AAD5T989_9FUNG|nr:hypothetical protein HK100_003744 [Physocladia obscura]